jgi:2-amino-4-hydroxy-6-hydroxymethyldihydropteridine diphosphokinase
VTPEAVFIALGSNLSDPQAQVKCAFDELAALPMTRLLKRSSLYRTKPVGYLDQPEFVNAVAQLETRLGPRELLDALLEIERRHARVRSFRNAPRTLDLDVLLYDEVISADPELILPHPRMHERAFVLVPLCEIAPDCVIPGKGVVAELARGATDPRPQRICE